MYDSTKPYKERVLEIIKRTWETPYVSVREGLVYKKFSFSEYHHSDGIGTKGIYHWQKRSFGNAVLDVLAMNLNDMLMQRARAYAIIDHLLVPEEDGRAIYEIVQSMANECKRRDIAITGGETAIHDNIQGLEISMTMLGFIEKPKPNKFNLGDILLGIKSNGLHSNGFTKVREVFGEEFREEFICPTEIYYDEVHRLNDLVDISGMMHITGGAYTKLKGLLNGADAVIKIGHKLEPQEIFQELYRRGVSDNEMYRTFNCGVGFVLGVSHRELSRLLNEIKGFDAEVIGIVVKGDGKVKIKSGFSKEEVEF